MPLTSASPTPSLAGVWVPIVTPFLQQAERPVDHAALGLLAKRLQAAAVHGLVVGGTTGEAFALSNAERLACWQTIASHAPHVPLMLGSGGASLNEALADMAWLADAQRAQELPLHAVLLAAPAYIRPSVAGLERWFSALADAAPAPVVIYDIPYRTGAVLPRELLLTLAQHPRIVGVKDCGGDWAKSQALLHDGRLQWLAGEDMQVLAQLAHGAVGCISASAHLWPERWVALYTAVRDHKLDHARQCWRELLPVIDTAFAEPNPAPIKAALAAQGLCSAAVRAPLCEASDAITARWQALGLASAAAVNPR